MIIRLVLITLALVCWLLSMGATMSFEDTEKRSDGFGAVIFGALALVLAFLAGTHA